MTEQPHEVLQHLRARSGRTLADVAAALGTSVPYMSDLERGRRNLHAILPPAFRSLVLVLGLDPDGDDAHALRMAILQSLADASPWAAVMLEMVEGTQASRRIGLTPPSQAAESPT